MYWSKRIGTGPPVFGREPRFAHTLPVYVMNTGSHGCVTHPCVLTLSSLHACLFHVTVFKVLRVQSKLKGQYSPSNDY